MYFSYRYRRTPDQGTGPQTNPGQNGSFDGNPIFGPYDQIQCITFSQVNLVNEMRYLWLQMVIWSRSYINNSAARQRALPIVYEKLYSIPRGFYNYMNLFFGPVVAEQFVNLLSQHVIIFANLIDSMRSGNQQAANASQSAWYENTNGIAALLVRVNNFWNNSQMQDLLVRYLEMLLSEALAIFSSSYREEIAIYDRLQYQSLRIADYMSSGVMNSLAGNHKGSSGPPG